MTDSSGVLQSFLLFAVKAGQPAVPFPPSKEEREMSELVVLGKEANVLKGHDSLGGFTR